MREDRYSNTEADAGAWERERGMSDDYDPRPTRREADAEAEAEQYYAGPDTVTREQGILCAHCKQYHGTVADVRWCSDLQAEARAEALAEQAAEARNERYFEEGPESFQMQRAAEEAHDQARAWNDPWA